MELVTGNAYKLFGELTMVGITQPVELALEFGGIVEKGPFGNSKVGFSVKGKINRKDWSITWNKALNSGGVAVGEIVKIKCHIELYKS